MSWSIAVVGTSAGICAELDRYGETLTDQSKEEFAEAKPHLKALVSLCVGETNALQLVANGHADFTQDPNDPLHRTRTYSHVAVSLDSNMYRIAV